MTTDIISYGEVELIAALSKSFLRSPSQLNKLYESDAELLALPGTDTTLALTTDALSEEIESGLYSDPYQIGWVTVMANASDLAAVGARPCGMLINETLPKGSTNEFLLALQGGVNAASRAVGIPILGGDTNFGNELHMAATAIGTIGGGPLISRIGCKPGELLFVSGPLGKGNCYAASAFGFSCEQIVFRPKARTSEGEIVRQFASACMDTSDGLLSTLDELMRLNGCGFDLTSSLHSYLVKDAFQLDPHVLKPWMALAGPHGEFELVFTIAESNHQEFIDAATRIGWIPILLGRVIPEPAIILQIDDNSVTIETSEIRSFVYDSKEKIIDFIRMLWRIEEQSIKESIQC